MRVSSTDFLKNYRTVSAQALTEPVTITGEGSDRLVLLSATEFERLKRFGRQTLAIEELDKGDIASIAQARVPDEVRSLDSLVDE